MSRERYYFDERNKDFLLSYLKPTAKTVLQYNEYVDKIYQKCTHLLHAYSSKYIMDLVKLNSQSIVSNCILDSNGSPKDSKVSKSSEAKKQETSTEIKQISDDSTLPIDYGVNEALQIVTAIENKQMTPVQAVQKSIESDVLTKQNLSPISPKEEKSHSCTEKRIPIQVDQNITEAEKFPCRRSQIGGEKMDKIEPFNVEYQHSPVRLQTMRVKPTKIHRSVFDSESEVGKKYLNPDDQDAKTACDSEANKRQHEKSTEAHTISAISPLKEALNFCCDTEELPTTDDGKDASLKEKATASDNQFSSSSEGETAQILQVGEVKIRRSIPIKKWKMSSNSATKSERSFSSDNKAEMRIHSYQDSKMNINPNQESNIFKSGERKKIAQSPRTDTLFFRSMPRIIKSSRGLESEIYIFLPAPENPIPTTSSPVLLVNSKITKPVADESIDIDRSSKNANLSLNEPRPGCSRDFSSPAKSTIAKSQSGAANTKSLTRDDVIDLGNDSLPYRYLEGSPTTKISANVTSLNEETLTYCINQLSNLIKRRQGSMQSIYNSLIGFSKCLGYLIIHIENILYVIQYISWVKKFCGNEDFIKNINGLIAMSATLINNLVSMRLDMEKDIEIWTKCLHEIKGLMKPLILNGKPLVSFKALEEFEDTLKVKWKTTDNTIPIIESRMSLFLSTAGDFEKCINLFVKCLINVGVLKLSSASFVVNEAKSRITYV